MKRIALLFGALLLSACQTLTPQSTDDRLTARPYRGYIESGGTLVPAITRFTQSDDGSMTGSYSAQEEDEDEPTPGTLTQCRAVGERQLQCIWKDKYGDGKASFVFARDYSQFFGAWTADHDVSDTPGLYKWMGRQRSSCCACGCGG